MLSLPLSVAKPRTKVDNVGSSPSVLSAINGIGHHFGRAANVEMALGIERIVDPSGLHQQRLPPELADVRLYNPLPRVGEFPECRPPRRQLRVKPAPWPQSRRVRRAAPAQDRRRGFCAITLDRRRLAIMGPHRNSPKPPTKVPRAAGSHRHASDVRAYAIIKERCRDGYATWRPRHPGRRSRSSSRRPPCPPSQR